jgi:hypothetical protein
MIGKLERVELRKVWEKEAKDFTSWLASHLDVLSEHLDVPLTLLDQEKAAGAFSADIFAEGTGGQTVVIENQLEKTDHDHLGKLITYISNLEAKTAIWISSLPRPEHVTAVEWLNEMSPADTSFYLVKVEAFRIGNSEPAPLFTIVCGPSAESKERGERKQEMAERHVERLEFWTQLLERAKPILQTHANRAPGKENWISAGAGKSGFSWNYCITKENGWVELSIDRGRDKEAETRALFDQLQKNSNAIDNAFGEPLSWDKEDDRRSCRIRSFTNLGGLKDKEKWPAIQDDLIHRLKRLVNALTPHLSKL